MRLKRGSEFKIKYDSVGGLPPDALFVLAVLEETELGSGWGLVLTRVMAIVLSSACCFFFWAHILHLGIFGKQKRFKTLSSDLWLWCITV